MEATLRIAIIGYGRMGKTVEKIAMEKGHRVSAIVDHETDWQAQNMSSDHCDVAIEFSTPEAVADNILKCFDLNIPVVSGTTGWQNRMEEVARICHQKDQSLFTASNFSIGVNLFFALNRHLASMLGSMKSYQPRITEIHHVQKLDAPSGTAITLANDIIQQRDEVDQWVLFNQHQESQQGSLPVVSIREGDVTGTHMVSYESFMDCIEIKHTAHHRSAFAEGAILAAQWLQHKKGVFGMQDLLKL